MPGLGGAGGPHGPAAAPRLEPVGQLLGEDPPVAGVTHAVEDGASGRDVVGLVERSRAEGVAEVAGDHDLGPVLAHHPGDRGAQVEAIHQHPVGEAEEVDAVDAHDARRLDLLRLADGAALVGVQPVDASLAAGDHAVDDVLALTRPARDRGRGAVLEVVGVGDDGGRPGPVLRERLHGRGPYRPQGAGGGAVRPMAASKIASSEVMPGVERCLVRAKSIIMIAFFFTMPISMIMPTKA